MSENPKTYAVPYELMSRLWATIDHYGNEFTYRGERIGGVLQGCPRGPNPTPDQLVIEARRTMRKLIEWRDKNYPTPPAAQAQDAGPMAEHWREAFAIWAGNRTAMGEFDRIEKRARALAAKEAK